MNPILIADQIAFRVGTKVCEVIGTELGKACGDKIAAGYFAMAFLIVVFLAVFGGRLRIMGR
jgi:hypothetical protein